MNKNNDKEESSATSHSVKDTIQDIWSKIVESGNKKYGFNFTLHGWVIAALGLILLILILK